MFSRLAKTSILVVGLMIVALALATLSAGATPSPGPSAASARSITLYGSYQNPAGWGWTPSNISNGLTLTVNKDDVITFHLYANDSMDHQLLIDLDNSHSNTTGDAFFEKIIELGCLWGRIQDHVSTSTKAERNGAF